MICFNSSCVDGGVQVIAGAFGYAANPSLFRQIDDQLDVADCQGKLKLVFKPCFLQHVCHMEFDR